jgi:hypothetical protein
MPNLLIVGIIIISPVVLIYPPNQLIFIQNSEALASVPSLKEWIKIVNPILDQKVSTGKELLISGQSSDSTAKDCSVSVIVNDVKPYQNAVASGPGGPDDFSQWKFLLREDYTPLIEGKNKMTAKLLCASAPTRWYGVFINGIPSYSNEEILSPVQSGQQSNLSTTTSSHNTNTNSNDNALLVSIFPQKNPVPRGDTQNTTITVSDSNSRAIGNAKIDGKLIYPRDNYEKEFQGSTDYEGKFVYSWTIGKNGDVGPLVTEVEVSSQGYVSSSVRSSFDIVDSSGSSGINNAVGNSLNNKKSEFDFVVAGDYGCDSWTRQTVNKMEDENPNLVLALGDLSEVKDPDCFFDLISKLDGDGKLKITLGEADTDSNMVHSSSRFSHFVRHFKLVNPFYSFDYQNVHFLAMSTGKSSYIPYTIGSAQYRFIEDDLARVANKSNIDWIIVFGYRPFYTSPTIHPALKNLRDTYAPLFEKYGVDLVITSHNHNYQRSYPLVYNIEHSRHPIVKDLNATYYYMPGVPVYVGVGTAGNTLYDFVGQAPFMAAQFQENGFLQVNISDNENEDKLTGTFHNIGTGTLDDQFVITKSKTD